MRGSLRSLAGAVAPPLRYAPHSSSLSLAPRSGAPRGPLSVGPPPPKNHKRHGCAAAALRAATIGIMGVCALKVSVSRARQGSTQPTVATADHQTPPVTRAPQRVMSAQTQVHPSSSVPVNLFRSAPCVWCGQPVGSFHILIASGSRRFRLCGQACLHGFVAAGSVPPP